MPTSSPRTAAASCIAGIAVVAAILFGPTAPAIAKEPVVSTTLESSPKEPAGTTAPALRASDHWAFTAPARPALPAIVHENWPRSGLDRFVLARLEAENLLPSDEADRATLLRRVTLDLTGLPPSPEAIATFELDTRDDAFERAVDGLLASPHFGERMALPWLDLARYADSNGYDFDNPREMWAWRDSVIAAFNANLSFDRFTIEQLAGDLLPNPTLDQRIASGFLRNQPLAYEMAGQVGEYEHQYVSDRVSTFATTWLGLTIGCAQCHDHKFDPISQRDYYRLYAIFNDSDDAGIRTDLENPVPYIRLPSKEQATQLATMEAKIASIRDAVNAATIPFESEIRRFLANERPRAIENAPQSDLRFPLDEEVPGDAVLSGIGKATWIPGVESRGKALLLDGKNEFVDCGDRGEFHSEDPFSIAAYVRIEGRGNRGDATIVCRSDGSHDGRGYRLSLAQGKPAFELDATNEEKGAIRIVARDALDIGGWHHVVATYDGSRLRTGLRLYVDGALVELGSKPKPAPAPNPRLVGEICERGDRVPLLIGCGDGTPYEGAIDDVRIYRRELDPPAVAAVVREQVHLIASLEERNVDQDLWLREWFAVRQSEVMKPLRDDLVAWSARRKEVLAATPVTSVSERLANPPATHLLVRGDYTNRGEVVEGGTPSVLPQLPPGVRADRLTLARWLVARENPLFSRVAVNRFWKSFFGRGLVSTSDDFGIRGEAPTNRELLDFLACEFVASGYDVKALVRTIVTSATYRQSSRVDPRVLAIDPENRWLSRAPRLRLDAEFVMDNALSIGGLLDPAVLGKSVPAYDEAAANAALLGTLLRRGLYVEVKRSNPNLVFAAFDASTREVCRADRVRTTTPLQALALLNEPTNLAASKGLARRMLAIVADDRSRLEYGMRCCVARVPSDRELEVLVGLLARMRADRAPRFEPARNFLGPLDRDSRNAEYLAWSDVASVLLNLDETSTRG